ncbi:MAG: hypothetical protein IJU79_07265 [Desulfovibrionaceae bacterium]|nr:hypothetical protein [Desulfovibrionaceae bacterium]
MLWEALLFGLVGIIGLCGVLLALFALHRLEAKNDNSELIAAIKKLESRPVVDVNLLKDLIVRVNKLDSVTTEQGKLLALVKKSAYQAEEISKKLSAVYNQTASNKI